jgi:hypothetical protein
VEVAVRVVRGGRRVKVRVRVRVRVRARFSVGVRVRFGRTRLSREEVE